MSLVALSLAAISANLGRLPYSPDLIYHVQRILLETDESAVQFICLKLLTKLYKRDKRNNKPLSPTRLIPFLDWLLRKEKRAAWDKSSGPSKLASLLNLFDCLVSVCEGQVQGLLLKHIDYFANGLRFDSESTWHITTIALCYLTQSEDNLLPIVEAGIEVFDDIEKNDVISLLFYHLHFLLYLMETNRVELADSLRLDRILLILNRFSHNEELFQAIERRLTQQISRGGKIMWWMDVVIAITRSSYCSSENRLLAFRLYHRLLSPFE